MSWELNLNKRQGFLTIQHKQTWFASFRCGKIRVSSWKESWNIWRMKDDKKRWDDDDDTDTIAQGASRLQTINVTSHQPNRKQRGINKLYLGTSSLTVNCERWWSPALFWFLGHVGSTNKKDDKPFQADIMTIRSHCSFSVFYHVVITKRKSY